MRIIGAVLVAIALVAGITPAWSQAGDGEGVVASYEALRTAISKGNGSAVADLASDESIALFGRLRDIAAKGSRMQVETLPPAQRFLVLRMRLKFGASIGNMDGKALLSAAAGQGMIGESLPSAPSRADIAIQGTRATAVVRIAEGKPSGYKLAFAKQRGGWKVDLGPLLSIADDEIRRASREDKLSENQLIEQLLGLLSPTGKVEPSLWEPVAPNAGAPPKSTAAPPPPAGKPAPVPNQTQGKPGAPPPPAPPPPAVIVPPR